MSKYYYNKDYFKKIDTHGKAYWLGFLYADGCITRFYKGEKLRSMSLEITLQSQDKDHLIKFRDALNSNVPIKDKIVANKYKSNRIVINYTGMCRDLINLGCVPQKSLILKFPDEDIVPKKFLNDFIRGYFDGDGGVSYTEGDYYNSARGKYYRMHSYSCYFCGNEQFITELRNALISNGIKVGELTKDNRSNAVSIYIYGKDNIENFKNYIYYDGCVCLSRKKEKFDYISSNKELHINS